MNIALIAAAGESKRMGGKIPKLLLPIHNKPLLYFTIACFYDHPKIDQIVLVINRKLKKPVENMLKAYFPGNTKNIKLIPGGGTRAESVLNGIQYISRYLKPKLKDLILIHNGANPIVSFEEIEKCMKKAASKGACIVTHPVKPTLKEINKTKIHKSHNREKFKLAQTPQIFAYKILKDSLEKVGTDYVDMTDEAQLAETAGHHVYHVPASEHNIKVTTNADYEFVCHALGDIPANYLVGIGQDSHEFEESGNLILGGLEFKNENKLKGNSDGDVLLHALCNGILQAIGEKSLGAFADDWCKVKKIKDSRNYLFKILKKVNKRGYKINNIGCMLEGKRPKIDIISPKLKANLANLCDIPERRIGITATSGENLTSFGKGKGLQCYCIVSLKKND
jgi:2-C-methyl-D-erythritol 4-phosphate cytidylyltransferase/2-C-methyl-D-erythritol 2,4-cyclodiphosphate synthase